MVETMTPLEPQESRVVKSQTSFMVAGWIFALVVLVGGIVGGIALWRRAKVASQELHTQIAKLSQSKQPQHPAAPESGMPSGEPINHRTSQGVAEPVFPAGESNPPGREGRDSTIVLGRPVVRHGSLDREIIQRVVRRHTSELKFCYEMKLTAQPKLSGRLMVEFTIGPSGQVLAAVLVYSSMANTQVENCVLQAVRRWDFPKPKDGGLVVIVYPFQFNS